MNRRSLVMLPGMALAAAGIAEAEGRASVGASRSPSHKAVSKYAGVKSYYYLPRSAAKQTKYVSFLTAYLGLTSGQTTQAADIFAQASAADAAVHQGIKTARQALATAVKYNDSASITSAATTIGGLTTQRHSIGANANTALSQILTGQQQTLLDSFRG